MARAVLVLVLGFIFMIVMAVLDENIFNNSTNIAITAIIIFLSSVMTFCADLIEKAIRSNKKHEKKSPDPNNENDIQPLP